MKTFFAFIILCSSILAVPFVVKAADPPTPTPTLEETCSIQDNACGGCIKSDGSFQNQLCCGTSFKDGLDATKVVPKTDKEPCILFICVGDVVNNAAKIFGGIIDNSLSTNHSITDENAEDSFSRAMGTCNDGFRKKLVVDGSDANKAVCSCVQNEGNTKTIATDFCTTYLATQKKITNLGQLREDKDVISCVNCFTGGGYWSAIGCVQLNSFQDFIEKNVFGWGLGLAGTFALGCIIYAAIQMQLSNGVPEKVKKSQEMITSCIMGLMVIIFSVFILRLIGVTILHIPGFS
jgi:hypothetical protein